MQYNKGVIMAGQCLNRAWWSCHKGHTYYYGYGEAARSEPSSSPDKISPLTTASLLKKTLVICFIFIHIGGKRISVIVEASTVFWDSSSSTLLPASQGCPGLKQWVLSSSLPSVEVVITQERKESFTRSMETASQHAFTYSQSKERDGAFRLPPRVYLMTFWLG